MTALQMTELQLADMKKVNLGICALANTFFALSLIASASQSQEQGTKQTSTPPQEGPQTLVKPLQGKVEEKAEPQSPLEGTRGQTAPLESGLKNEQLNLQAMSDQLFGKSSNLAGQTTTEGKSTKLQGRLEQIDQSDAKLPVELISKINKTRPIAEINLVKLTPRFAVMPPPTLLKGNLTSLSASSSFPDFVVGTWGGHLRVLTREIFQPEITDAKIVVNELGTIVVRFIKDEDKVSVIPPSIFFKRRLLDRKHHMMRREGDPNKQEDLRPEIYYDYPIIDMGSKHWHNAIGGQWQDEILHHSLQSISENSAEQDTVFERTKDGTPYGYRETVARYTWTSKTKIFMQAAVVDFALDRTLRKRTTMEGYIVTEWHPFAQEISSIANSPWEEIVKLYDLKINW